MTFEKLFNPTDNPTQFSVNHVFDLFCVYSITTIVFKFCAIFARLSVGIAQNGLSLSLYTLMFTAKSRGAITMHGSCNFQFIVSISRPQFGSTWLIPIPFSWWVFSHVSCQLSSLIGRPVGWKVPKILKWNCHKKS